MYTGALFAYFAFGYKQFKSNRMKNMKATFLLVVLLGLGLSNSVFAINTGAQFKPLGFWTWVLIIFTCSRGHDRFQLFT